MSWKSPYHIEDNSGVLLCSGRGNSTAKRDNVCSTNSWVTFMEKTSIKEISAAEFERALAEVLQKFTGKEWNVSVDEMRHDEKNFAFSSNHFEGFKLSLHAETKLLPPSDLPF